MVLGHTAPCFEGCRDLLDGRGEGGHHLEDAAHEHRAALVGEDRGVLRREGESAARWIVVHVLGGGHGAQPFQGIALMDVVAGRKLDVGGAPLLGEVLEERQPVANDAQLHDHRSAQPLTDLDHEPTELLVVDARCGRHHRPP